MSKLLTIVIPAYNVEKYLGKCVNSFLQDEILNDIEVLIVNDGSEDKTAEIGKNFEKSFPQTVRLINKKNGGHGSTINVGIREATGKYFKVVDGDDWVNTENFVKFVKKLFFCDTDVIITPFERVNVDTHERKVKRIDYFKKEGKYNLSDVIIGLNDVYQIHSLTFKTNIIKQIKSISEKCFYVDQQYIVYPLRFAKNIKFINLLIYEYRVGNENQSVSLTNYQKNIEMLEKVAISLANFESEEMITDKNIQQFCVDRAAGVAQKVVHIYLSMSLKNKSKSSLKDFIRKIRITDNTVYKNIPGFEIKVLKVNYGLLFYPLGLAGQFKRMIWGY